MKRIRVLITMLIIISSSFVYSQSFNLILDPINPFMNQPLFNLTFVNFSDYSGPIILRAELKDVRGKSLTIQTLSQTILSNETKSIRGNELSPNVESINSDFSNIYRHGQLPPLNYVLCVSVIANGDTRIKEEACIEYYASDLMQISAIYPPSGAEISELRPLFSWLDPQQQDYLQYQFRLVEMESGQRPTAALRRNEPIISMDQLQTNQLLYPSDAVALKNGNNYAWQVAVSFNEDVISRSEPIEFSYKDHIEYVDYPKNMPYVDVTEINVNSQLLAVGSFKFKYPSDRGSRLTFKLTQLKKNELIEISLTQDMVVIENGVNMIELDLKEQVNLKHLKLYQLNIEDGNTGKVFPLNIQYVNPDYIIE